MIFAGLFLLASLGLAHLNGQVNLGTPSWLWFTLFVGANLTFTGLLHLLPVSCGQICWRVHAGMNMNGPVPISGN